MLGSFLHAPLQGIIDFLGRCGDAVGTLLYSPFLRVDYIIKDIQVLQFINWLLPISEVIALLELWGLAIAAWYIAMTMLRWAKTIQ